MTLENELSSKRVKLNENKNELIFRLPERMEKP